MDRVAKVAQHMGGGAARSADFVAELATLSELFRAGTPAPDAPTGKSFSRAPVNIYFLKENHYGNVEGGALIDFYTGGEGMLSEAEFALGKAKLLSPAPARPPPAGPALPPPVPAAAVHHANMVPSAAVAAAAAAETKPAGPVQMTDRDRFLYDLQG